jgi:hypothetical protein
MAKITPELVSLRRTESGLPWGFRLMGGRDIQLPLFAVACSPKGIAGKAGLGNGDAIVQICGMNVMQYTNQEAKTEMLRAGNELDLWVVRGAVDTKDPAVKAACGVGQAKRSDVVEDSIDPHMNEGTKYRTVVPKSYQILEAQLGTEAAPPAAQPQPPPQPMQPVHSQSASSEKPASIFDRKQQDRSDYLKAQGETIMKAYGSDL